MLTFKQLLLSVTLLSTPGFVLAQQAPAPGKYALNLQAGRSLGRQLGGGVPLVTGTPRLRFSPQLTLVDNLQAVGDFTLLVKSAERGAMVAPIQADGPFTVFAPTDAAFSRLPPGLLADLWKPASQARLGTIVAAHIVRGTFKKGDFTDGLVLTTLAGTTLTVRIIGGRIAVEDAFGKLAYLGTMDQEASNGMVHDLDRVLALP